MAKGKKAKKVAQGGKSPKSKAQKAKQQRATRQKINAKVGAADIGIVVKKTAKEVKRERRKEQKQAAQIRARYKKFEEKRRKEDAKEKLKFNEKRKKQFDKGYIVYQQLLAMINQAKDSGFGPGADHLLNVIKEEISIFGVNEVYYSMSEAPQEVIESAQVAIHYEEGSYPHDTAITAILEIIKAGVPISLDELYNLYGDAMEQGGDDYIK